MTDDPVDAFLLLLPMKMMMVTISAKKMDDNDTEVNLSTSMEKTLEFIAAVIDRFERSK